MIIISITSRVPNLAHRPSLSLTHRFVSLLCQLFTITLTVSKVLRTRHYNISLFFYWSGVCLFSQLLEIKQINMFNDLSLRHVEKCTDTASLHIKAATERQNSLKYHKNSVIIYFYSSIFKIKFLYDLSWTEKKHFGPSHIKNWLKL